MKKALFFDIDGTLVSFETHQIPKSTIKALKLAKEKGHRLFIATGRPKAIINNLDVLGDSFFDGFITMNGGYCFTEEKVIHQSNIPESDVVALANYCEKNNHPVIFVYEHNVAVANTNKMLEEIFYDYLKVDKIPTIAFDQVTKDKVFQITPFLTLEQEQEILEKMPNCETERWFPAFTDFVAKGNTKQRGIDEIINYFNIPLEDTIAFGDGGNDISMLKHANIGVAMGNAHNDVKKHADMVTSTVDNNGIWNAMNELSLL